MARTSDEDYLRQVEAVAREVVEAASDEGWLAFDCDSAGTTPLQGAVNKLARLLRFEHCDGDGCTAH